MDRKLCPRSSPKKSKNYRLVDYGQDIRTTKMEFQADIAAIRGYQLYVMSCYSGNNKQSAKYKLFEASVRARQIGGDEAGAALICMSEDPRAVESDVAQVMQVEGRFKVFGRRELQHLEQHLQEWFTP